MSQPVFNISKEFRFDAAHHLDAGPGGDPRYRRMHGHSYQVEVWVRGPANERGWVVDMGDLERRIDVARDMLDHRLLNDVPGLGIPTMENISRFVWEKLGDLRGLNRVVVKRVQNGEICEYQGPSA
ncbi:MAG TPA: 6-carboxytetrahydropterin synthase [Rhodanobacteraceae bacterium]